MTIEAYVNLSSKARQKAIELETRCVEYDNLCGSFFLDSSLNIDSRIKSFFFFYQNRRLVSMLSMFIPSQREAEITGYTLPEFRRNGYFKALLSKAIEELKKFNIQKLILVCEHSSVSGKEVIKGLNAEYKHTEYFMKFVKSQDVSPISYQLRLVEATEEDLQKAVGISMEIFGGDYEESLNLVKRCLESDIRAHYFGMIDDKIIGAVSVRAEGEEATIFGFGILPDYRGKGFGRELLYLILNRLTKEGRRDIGIEVSSENEGALSLYQKMGFCIEAAYEYYELEQL